MLLRENPNIPSRTLATHNLYTQTASDLGYAALPTPVGGLYYTLNVTCSDKTCSTGYTPTGSQLKDTSCTGFSVDQTGLQAATGAANASTACGN